MPRRYKFEGKIIKLSPEDYKKWSKEFDELVLEDELYRLDRWLEEKSKKEKVDNWFWVIPKILSKKQIEEKSKKPQGLYKYL